MTTRRSAQPMLLATLLLTAGCTDDEPVALVRNECLLNSDCEREQGASCGTQKMCERELASAPYEVILQVRQNAANFNPRLVPEISAERFVVRRTDKKELEIPRAKRITGRVAAAAGLVSAQVTFKPKVQVSQSSAIVTDTRFVDAMHNLTAQISPDTDYEVTVQPVGKASETLPPITRELRADAEEGELIVLYPELQKVSGRLVGPIAGVLDKRVRLQSDSGEVVSSTTHVQTDGSFAVYALPSKLERPYQLVISLSDETPWRVTIAIDGDRLNADVPIPSVPRRVLYSTTVGAGSDDQQTSAEAGVPFANVTFVSSFSDTNDAGVDNNRAWCRVPGAPAAETFVHCRANINTTADFEGKLSLPLVPGDYHIFLSPSRGTVNANSLAATEYTEAVRVPEILDPIGDAGVVADAGLPTQGFRTLLLQPAARFRGLVRSYVQREPMPNVTLLARSLGYGTGRLKDIALYSRSATAVTRRNGLFELALDKGYFDLYVIQPEGSGFAWAGVLNNEIDPDADAGLEDAGFRARPEVISLKAIEPTSPVYITGTVFATERPDGGAPVQKPLAGAEIEAFALVESLNSESPTRTVSVGRATADDLGQFRLPLPPAVDHSIPVEDAGVDAGSATSSATGSGPTGR